MQAQQSCELMASTPGATRKSNLEPDDMRNIIGFPMLLLLMDEILHHLVSRKPYELWDSDKPYTNWCRILSINSSWMFASLSWNGFNVCLLAVNRPLGGRESISRGNKFFVWVVFVVVYCAASSQSSERCLLPMYCDFLLHKPNMNCPTKNRKAAFPAFGFILFLCTGSTVKKAKHKL